MLTLKNCPFCRGRAELLGAAYSGPADCWDTLVRCLDCEACGPAILGQHGDDQEIRCAQAAAGWNGRALDADDFSDNLLATIIELQRVPRIQGFSYPPQYVIRDVSLSWTDQVIWSIGQRDPNAKTKFERQCLIEGLRAALKQATTQEAASAQKTAQ